MFTYTDCEPLDALSRLKSINERLKRLVFHADVFCVLHCMLAVCMKCGVTTLKCPYYGFLKIIFHAALSE